MNIPYLQGGLFEDNGNRPRSGIHIYNNGIEHYTPRICNENNKVSAKQQQRLYRVVYYVFRNGMSMHVYFMQLSQLDL